MDKSGRTNQPEEDQADLTELRETLQKDDGVRYTHEEDLEKLVFSDPRGPR